MNYTNAVKRIENILEKTKAGTLATANSKGEISASQVNIVNDGLTIYFQTDKFFEKINNIQENPNVALNCGVYYFKGKARIVGHPTSNPVFIAKIKEKHPDAYAHFSMLPNEILIEIKLTSAKFWGFDEEHPFEGETLYLMDIENNIISKKICDIM